MYVEENRRGKKKENVSLKVCDVHSRHPDRSTDSPRPPDSYTSTSTVSSSASLPVLRTDASMLSLLAGGSTGREKGSISAAFS